MRLATVNLFGGVDRHSYFGSRFDRSCGHCDEILRIRQRRFQAAKKLSYVDSVHQSMMNFYRDRHHQALVLFKIFSKDDSRDRITAPFGSRVRKAGEAKPRQGSVVNHVVTHGWFQAATAGAYLVNRLAHAAYKLFKIALVIK